MRPRRRLVTTYVTVTLDPDTSIHAMDDTYPRVVGVWIGDLLLDVKREDYRVLHDLAAVIIATAMRAERTAARTSEAP